MFSELDVRFMQHALKLAQLAEQNDEVPVGAILVHEDKIIGEGMNQPITTSDPTAHAEVVAIRNAAQHVKNYRLVDTTMYVTLEPCAMCVGAIIHARIQCLVFGATDPKTGAVQSVCQLLDEPAWNHQVVYEGGLLAEQSATLLKNFFKQRR